MKKTLVTIVSLLGVAVAGLAADSDRHELATKLVTVMRVADRNRSELSDALPKLKDSNPRPKPFGRP